MRANPSLPVLPAPNNLYYELRVRWGLARSIREAQDSPPERLLQVVWQHQRLLRDRLQTRDGQRLMVLHPGFWSMEGGPDFRQALVQFGDDPPRQGDVEVDVRSSGWKAHGHHTNAAFKNVVLHVVWEAGNEIPGTPPMLVLKDVLDSPIGELGQWLNSEGLQELPSEFRGKCCAPLSKMDPAIVRVLLEEAAEVRLAAKASGFASRARQAGWEQALWEGLFRALGYKHNSWPMQRLGELRSRWAVAGSSALELQARLFGIGGMLPAELRTGTGEGRLVRKLWDCWWRERDGFSDCLLPHQAWRMHGLRPANHPHRRLALAAQWSATSDLPKKLEHWCAEKIASRSLGSSLEQTLRAPEDEFWSWHWTLRSTRMARPQPLLGKGRVTDLAINVVLPWLAARAKHGGQQGVLEAIRSRYFAWPAADDNSVLKLARQRLLGTTSTKLFSTAASQQGLIQIIRDFCDHSNSICDKCRLPEMTEEYQSKSPKCRSQFTTNIL